MIITKDGFSERIDNTIVLVPNVSVKSVRIEKVTQTESRKLVTALLLNI